MKDISVTITFNGKVYSLMKIGVEVDQATDIRYMSNWYRKLRTTTVKRKREE